LRGLSVGIHFHFQLVDLLDKVLGHWGWVAIPCVWLGIGEGVVGAVVFRQTGEAVLLGKHPPLPEVKPVLRLRLLAVVELPEPNG